MCLLTDLKLLVNRLSAVETDWFDIGLQLGIKIDTLKSFETDKYNNRRRLTEVLSFWLKQNTDIAVSWESIVNALRSVDQNALASDLEDEFINNRQESQEVESEMEQDNDQAECEVEMDRNGKQERTECEAAIEHKHSDTDSIKPPSPKIRRKLSLRKETRRKLVKCFLKRRKQHSIVSKKQKCSARSSLDVTNGK